MIAMTGKVLDLVQAVHYLFVLHTFLPALEILGCLEHHRDRTSAATRMMDVSCRFVVDESTQRRKTIVIYRQIQSA